MPKNEDGEFELVLGNKQLLSMFFVVVVLLGVFFVMGYIVGRNSAPLVASESTHKPEAKPLVVDSPAPKQTPAPEAEPNPAPAASVSQPAENPAAKSPEPAPATPTPAPQAVAKAEPAKPEAPAKREARVAEQAKAAKGRGAAPSSQPVAGAVYLQLSATDKPDADKMVEVLRKNNFQALDSEVPEKPGTFRVLVGPVPTGEYNKWKADLQSKGFPGNAAIRKTF